MAPKTSTSPDASNPERPVTTPDNTDLEPIRRRDDLLLPFVEACKPREAWRIGPEMEKFGVFADTHRPVPYRGERSILRVLEELSERHGFAIEREHEGGPIISLTRGGESITLEPGGQLELSGKKSETVHQVCAEQRAHLREIAPVSAAMGVRWLGLGFQPFAAREDFEWVPKQRYGFMREYLPTRGGHALDMMLRTCTVQANYDYGSEADAMRKMRVALALAPLTTAMFANSPWKEGRPHGGLTYRGRVWLDVDPDRSGLLPRLWKVDARFDDYVEWALDVPMFLFKRGGHAVGNTGQSFRSFWKDGYQGHHATLEDWKTHLNTLFPEVRLKRTIEVRGADAQSVDTACALPALYTGIFYDDRALAEAEALVDGWTYEEVVELRPRACQEGLRAVFRGQKLAVPAARVVTIAEGGLERRKRLDASGRDERIHLARLKKLAADGKTPADALLELVAREQDFARAVVEHASLKVA
jgi:glutamate--cysteine ligase